MSHPVTGQGRSSIERAGHFNSIVDAIRTFGLLWFLGFSAVVARAAGVRLRLVSEEARGLRIAVIAAFIASGANPVLISPLFSILVVASYYFLSAAQPTRRD